MVNKKGNAMKKRYIRLLSVMSLFAQNIMALGEVAEAEQIQRRPRPVKHYVVQKPAKANPIPAKKVVFHREPAVQPQQAPAKRYIILPPAKSSTMSRIQPTEFPPHLKLGKPVGNIYERPKEITLKEREEMRRQNLAVQPTGQEKPSTVLETLKNPSPASSR